MFLYILLYAIITYTNISNYIYLDYYNKDYKITEDKYVILLIDRYNCKNCLNDFLKISIPKKDFQIYILTKDVGSLNKRMLRDQIKNDYPNSNVKLISFREDDYFKRQDSITRSYYKSFIEKGGVIVYSNNEMEHIPYNEAFDKNGYLRFDFE